MKTKTAIKIATRLGVAGAIAGVVIGGGYIAYKIYKKKTQKHDTEEIFDEEEFCEEVNASDDFENKTDDEIIDLYTEFLIYNGVDVHEANAVADTIKILHDETDTPFVEVRDEMIDLMTGEYNEEASRGFDMCNFINVYHDMDVHKMFNKNGIVVVSLGADHQDDMMKLEEALIKIKEYDKWRFGEFMYAIDSMFRKFTSSPVDSTTYDTYFKEYVDAAIKFVETFTDVNDQDTTEETIKEVIPEVADEIVEDAVEEMVEEVISENETN